MPSTREGRALGRRKLTTVVVVGVVIAGLLAAWFVLRDDSASGSAADSADRRPGSLTAPPPGAGLDPGPALTGLPVDAANRRAPVPGLYDWSKAGYRSGAALPGDA